MSKWDEAHTEPMHDHPAEKEQLVAAMEAAGYVLDTLESTEDNLRFYGAYGNVMTMGGWDPQRAALRAVEDAVEQNDNNFDGIINNMPQPDPAEALRQQAKESAVSDERRSVLAELKASQAEAAKAAEAEARKHRPRLIRDEGAPVRV